MVAYNVFPLFSSQVTGATLVGASASVLAIVAATAYREPDYRVQLFLFGAIRLKYLALVVIGIDVLSITSSNAGGHIAHLGGALAGLIEKICRETAEQTGSEVSIANYNCPGQIVISGQEEAVHLAGETCKASGAKRVVPLKVSGPFHSKMLQGAGEKLKEELKKVEISDSFVPYIANVTADYVTKKEEVKPLLASQVSSSVRWQQTIERLLADGADEFVEIGPGRTLSGFVKKVNRDVKVSSIDKMEDFIQFIGSHVEAGAC